MEINYNHCLDASIYGEERKEEIFRKVNEQANAGSSGGLLALSLPIGLSLAFITLATKISTVGEIIFKGVSNITDGYKEENESKINLGARQLSIVLFAAIVDLVVGAPLHMLSNVIGDSIRIGVTAIRILANAKDPLDYTQGREAHHKHKVEALKTASVPLDEEHLLTLLADKLEEISEAETESYEDILNFFKLIGSTGVEVISILANIGIYGQTPIQELLAFVLGSDDSSDSDTSDSSDSVSFG